ncbi:MAG: hypothetical protein DHS20C14_10530 [Phycisphaeraceae bacterium]|nr:MAG: hypothetical protein DHS20C14_10530 [Phycisphaeraceae bacterium]
MAGRDPGVIVRRAQRFDVVLPASVRIGDEHADVVRFGPRAGDRQGWAEGDLMDIGSAGAGFIGTVFFPRGTKVVLRIFDLGKRDDEPVLEVPGKVVRVIMTDRRPAYLIGVGFQGLGAEDAAAVEELIERFGDPTDPNEIT